MATLRTDEIRVTPRGQLQTHTVRRRFRSDDRQRPEAIEIAILPARRNQRLRGRPAERFNCPEPGHALVATVDVPSEPGPVVDLTLMVQVDDDPPQTIQVSIQHAPPP